MQNEFETVDEAFNEVVRLREENKKLRDGINGVESLISESSGVGGLHLNGDFAPWDELRTGGRFEGWLVDFDIALNIAQGKKVSQ